MNDIFNQNKKVLAIIPARGGSKGIPRKNLVPLCGKPLIAYSIEAALNAETIDRVVVSTDDEEIAKVSRYHGAETPFLRPRSLADDRSNLEDVLTHALEALGADGYEPDVVVQLLPTHIFRNPKLINMLVNKTLNGYESVKTVRMLHARRGHFFFKNKDGTLYPVTAEKENGIPEESHYYRTYGLFISLNLTTYQPHGIFLHPLTDPIQMIDIDTPDDLEKAVKIIENRLFDFTQA